MLAVSLDGRLAPPEGGPAQIGGSGDRQVLEEALTWADGCLVGARTLRLHGSTCLIHRPELLEQRRLAGRSPQPMAIVVSRAGRLDPALPFFSQPLQRGLLREAVPGVATPQPQGFDQVWPLASWPAALDSLAATGLHRLALLGGAELAGTLLALDLVQELQLTLCPRLLGGRHTWLPAGVTPAGGDWALLEQRPLGQGELLLRYRRSTDGAVERPAPGPGSQG